MLYYYFFHLSEYLLRVVAITDLLKEIVHSKYQLDWNF